MTSFCELWNLWRLFLVLEFWFVSLNSMFIRVPNIHDIDSIIHQCIVMYRSSKIEAFLSCMCRSVAVPINQRGGISQTKFISSFQRSFEFQDRKANNVADPPRLRLTCRNVFDCGVFKYALSKPRIASTGRHCRVT